MVFKNFGAPLATKFAYKMRSAGKGMWGLGLTLYKHNLIKKKTIGKAKWLECLSGVSG
jgi:hypothetical protein